MRTFLALVRGANLVGYGEGMCCCAMTTRTAA
jgi:hypothetical protein